MLLEAVLVARDMAEKISGKSSTDDYFASCTKLSSEQFNELSLNGDSSSSTSEDHTTVMLVLLIGRIL